MGLDRTGTKFLIFARSVGVDFSKTATIGRQGLHVGLDTLKCNFTSADIQIDQHQLEKLFQEYSGYSEGFFSYLGAEVVDSFDYSSYEKATHLHDMNEPISETFKQHYTVVIDAGSLEHVFNFPVAIKNCMEMVQVNGHFIGITPCNNLSGHGFYQFSPDLFFRIFEKNNGFRMVKVILFEDDWEQQDISWYEVIDPQCANKQVTFVNRKPTYLMMIAQKIEAVNIFENIPQQSFYTLTWNDQTSDLKPETSDLKSIKTPSKLKLKVFFRHLIPAPLKSLLKSKVTSIFSWLDPGYDPDFFKIFNPLKK